MMKESFKYIKVLGLLLFFGLCITMLSKDVTAFAAESNVKLNVKSTVIIKEGTFQLKVYNMSETQTVLFRSSDTSIAAVTKDGLITGIANGTAVISANVMDGETLVANLQCDVLIGPAAISIKLTKSELTLGVGMRKTLKTIISPLNTVESAIFYSSDTSIATVTSVGRIRTKEPGQVQVFAFLSNGQSAICTVTVLSAEDYQTYLNEKNPDDSMLPDLDTDEEAETGSKASDTVQAPTATPSPAVTETPQNTATPVPIIPTADANVVTIIPPAGSLPVASSAPDIVEFENNSISAIASSQPGTTVAE